MSRTAAFLSNSITTALLQVITMISGFILPKVMLRAYGSEVNGLVSSITQFISYFSLVEAGLRSAAVYSLYKPLSEKDHPVINGIMAATQKMYLQSGYIFVALIAVLSVVYPTLINCGSISFQSTLLLIIVLGVNGTLDFFAVSKYRVLLVADQKTYVLSIASIVHIVLFTVITMVMANLGADILTLRTVALLSLLSRTFIMWLYCKKRYPYLNTKGVKPLMDRLNKRWDALILQILGVVQSGAPIIIITVILNDLKQVSVFSIYNMVLVGITGILSIFTSGLASSFGDVIARNENEVLRKTHREFEIFYYLIISVVYAITFVSITAFVKVYTLKITDTDYIRPALGYLIAFNGLLYNLKTPQGMLVISAGMYRETRWQTAIQSGLALVLGVIFAYFYGVEGVILGSIVSNIYRDIDLGIFVPRRITKTKASGTFLLMARSLVSVGIVYGISTFIHFDGHTYGQWALYALKIALVALVVCLGINLAMDYKAFQSVFSRLERLVRGRRK